MSRRAPRGTSLLEKLEYYTSKPNANGCRLWTASTTKSGHPHIWWKGKVRYAARLKLEEHLGRKLRRGMECCHNCPGDDNPRCMELTHLREDTHQANMDDRSRKGRSRGPKGIAHGKAKLNDDAVREMRVLRKSNTWKFVAESYGVSIATARAAVNGTHWGHVK